MTMEHTIPLAAASGDERDETLSSPREPVPLEECPAALEALLFLSGEPVSVGELARTVGQSEGDVLLALERLATDLEEGKRGLRLLRAPEGVQLVTGPAHGAMIEAFLKAGMREHLSPAAAETLAIVAYRGPIHRAGVEAIRGVNSSFTLRLLTIRGLIERGPNPTDSRVFLYRVSAEFLRHLGLTNLQGLPEYDVLHTHPGMTALEKTADVPATPPVVSSPSTLV